MKKFTRRIFIKSGIAFGGLSLLKMQMFPKIISGNHFGEEPDIVSVSADDPLGNMAKLIEPLGGIEKFVKKGSSVGFLINSPWQHPGTYTSPDVALSMIRLCLNAGAGDIIVFKPVPSGYWERGKYYDDFKDDIKKFTYCSDRVKVEIPDGVELKDANVFKGFTEVDVFINIPVAKHHAGTLFSGTLKNLMGVSSSTTNRYMHSPDGDYTYDKPKYLSQCIADLGLVRKPDLSIIDADVCALSNGPRGPGRTVKTNKILASTDPLAIDVYSANLIGFYPEDILTFEYAAKHGIGKADLSEMVVMEL